MKLFEMKNNDLQTNEALWGLLPFKALLKRDKSRQKEIAFKEVLFIYFYCDIRSDYVYITDNTLRAKEIQKDVGLPPEWKIDKILQEAIDMYESKTITPVGKLYKSSLKSADDISNYLESTDELLKERTEIGRASCRERV